MFDFCLIENEQDFYRNMPTKFKERATTGARMVSHCYSPGGNLVATGCTDHYIRIFRITSDCGVVKLFEKEAHTVSSKVVSFGVSV